MSTANHTFVAQEKKSSNELPFRTYIESYSLFQLLDDLNGQHILDMGCGDGHYTRKLKAAGAERVVGIDFSKKKINQAEAAEARHPLGCRYVQVDPANLPPMPIFDRVVAMYLLNNAKTKKALVNTCRTAFQQLKSGGYFLGYNDNPFNCPTEYPRYRKYGFIKQAASRRKDGTPIRYTFFNREGAFHSIHHYYWTPLTYRKAFEAAGFVDFEWIEPELPVFQLANPLWEQFMAHPPVIGFRARKP